MGVPAARVRTLDQAVSDAEMRRVEAERSAADAAAALETSRQQFESMEVCAMGGARHPLTARVRAPRIAQWCRSRARHRGPLTRNLSSVGFWEVRQTKKKILQRATHALLAAKDAELTSAYNGLEVGEREGCAASCSWQGADVHC